MIFATFKNNIVVQNEDLRIKETHVRE